MRLLIDTQVFIWFQLNDAQLPKPIRLLIEDPENDVFVSHLSFIEVTIKQVVNRLPTFTVQTESLLKRLKSMALLYFLSHLLISLLTSKFHSLTTTAIHGPTLRFDRLLLATALAEQMPTISADEKFSRYQGVVDIIW